jgi:hypothetical protein
MSYTAEFIYKGYFEGLSKHDKAVHILKKQDQSEPYYMFKLNKNLKIGDKFLINYNGVWPYKKGQLILGGVCE